MAIRYSIRTILLVTAIVAVGLAILRHNNQANRRTIDVLENRGFLVRYDAFFPRFLCPVVGEYCFVRIRQVLPTNPLSSGDMALINGCPGIDTFLLAGSNVDDSLVKKMTLHKDVVWIDVSDSAIGDEGLRELARACPNARKLSIEYTKITSEGLSKLHEFKELEEISVNGYHLTDKSIRFLSLLSELKRITLNGDSVTDEMLLSLRGLQGISAVRLFWTTNVTDAGIDAFHGRSRARAFRDGMSNDVLPIEGTTGDTTE